MQQYPKKCAIPSSGLNNWASSDHGSEAANKNNITVTMHSLYQCCQCNFHQ